MAEERMARLERLLAAARRIRDPGNALGKRSRKLLVESTGLSPSGVELALQQCLEADAHPQHIQQLCAGVAPSPRAHVLLSAHVFTATLRAVALGLAAAQTVHVRPSRREPHMAALLAEASGDLFSIVPELTPQAGEQLWAYGADSTLRQVRAGLPSGVLLHAHGAGYGVIVWQGAVNDAELIERLVIDTILFEQRGCLSPRLVIVEGPASTARELARALARGLSDVAERVPRGELTADELADITRYRDTLTYAGELFGGSHGYVGVDADSGFVSIAPVGRNLHVVPVTDAMLALAQQEPSVTTVAVHGTPQLGERVRVTLPRARICAVGAMQSPPLDGPVDLRQRPLMI